MQLYAVIAIMTENFLHHILNNTKEKSSMETKDKISFFLELINCNYELHHWSFDLDFNLLETDWENALFSCDFFEFVNFKDLLFQHLSEKNMFQLCWKQMPVLCGLPGFNWKMEIRSEST